LCAQTVDTYIHPYLPPYGTLRQFNSFQRVKLGSQFSGHYELPLKS
jgi:hypothetical protein